MKQTKKSGRHHRTPVRPNPCPMNVRYVCTVRMYRESGWVNKLLEQVYWYAMCCVCIDVYVGKSIMGMNFCGNQDGERPGDVVGTRAQSRQTNNKIHESVR